MDFILREDTAIVVPIGPLVDVDGAPITTATISQADVLLRKTGDDGTGAYSQKSDATSCDHRSHGMYDCPLNATDTSTPGFLQLSVAETGALVLRHTYMVMPQQKWDSFYGTDRMMVDVLELNSDANAAIRAATSFGLMDLFVVEASGSNSPTQIQTDLASTTDDKYVNRTAWILTGACAGQMWKIGDYVGSTGVLVALSPETFTTTPSAGATGIVL